MLKVVQRPGALRLSCGKSVEGASDTVCTRKGCYFIQLWYVCHQVLEGKPCTLRMDRGCDLSQ